MRSTEAAYTRRLTRLQGRAWKRFVPNPYRWHIRRVCSGRVLDVGSGIGRCLAFLDGRGIGVDPNETAVAESRARGFTAYTPAELAARPELTGFDTLLCSHVIEHLEPEEATVLLETWLPRIRTNGRVVLICPQERGQASDPTHRHLMGPESLRGLARDVGIEVERVRSFPFPRWMGRWWVHNETVLIGRVP